MNTRQFVIRHRIHASVDPADSNPNIDGSDGWSIDANHWSVTLRMDRRRMTVPYTTGSALSEPEAADVLDSLASDAQGVQYTRDFEEWASDLGYDPDSRRAEQAYRITVRQSAKLQAFLGADLYAQLLEAERL